MRNTRKMRVIKQVPTMGYILPLWQSKGDYRSTAVAYCKREKVKSVENLDGETYTLQQLQTAVIGAQERRTVKGIPWLEALAGVWLKEQPEVIQQTLKQYV